MRILKASEGKVFAYKDTQGQEIILGSIIYLGINDDESRYYEIEIKEEEHDRQD
jgi:hypothetical protein